MPTIVKKALALVVPENHHCDPWPVVASTCCELVHGDAESAVSGKAYDWHIWVANLCTQDGREAIASEVLTGDYPPHRAKKAQPAHVVKTCFLAK